MRAFFDDFSPVNPRPDIPRPFSPAMTPHLVVIVSRTYEEARDYAENMRLNTWSWRWTIVVDKLILGLDRGTAVILPNAYKLSSFRGLYAVLRERNFHIYYIDVENPSP